MTLSLHPTSRRQPERMDTQEYHREVNERQDATTAILKREEAAKKIPAYLVKEYGEHVFIVRCGQEHVVINDGERI